MKQSNKYRLFITVLTFIMIFVSCEKPETQEIISDTAVQEGFYSTTGNANSTIDINNVQDDDLTLESFFHIQLDGGMSEEKAMALADKKMREYLASDEGLNARGSSEVFIKIGVLTGSQNGNGTNANIWFRLGLRYQGLFGKATTSWGNFRQNNNVFGRQGQWDFVYARAIPEPGGPLITSIGLRWGQLALQGTDEWVVRRFNVEILTSDQTAPAVGYSSLFAIPNVILDNIGTMDWDYYFTGNIGQGSVAF